MGADEVRALLNGEEFAGKRGRGAIADRAGRGLRGRVGCACCEEGAEEAFARGADEEGEPQRGTKLAEAAEYGDARVGVCAEEEAHAGVEDEAFAGNSGAVEIGKAGLEVGDDFGDDGAGIGVDALGAGAGGAVVHEDELCVGVADRFERAGGGERGDVVDEVDAEANHFRHDLRLVGIDGNWDLGADEVGGDGREARDFIGGGDRLAVGVGAFGAEIDDGGAGGMEAVGGADGFFWVEVGAPVRE